MMSAHPRQLVFTRERVRRVDAEAVARYGIPGIVLMENAARQVADVAQRMLETSGGRRVLIVCGGGNNGGDGLAAGRHLHNRGYETTLVLTRRIEQYDGDARTNLDICRAMRLNLVEADADPATVLRHLPPHHLILDGLLGTGLSSEVRPPLTEVIAWVHSQETEVLSIDIPSGLDCDTGRPLGCAVRATATLSLVGVKKGFTHSHAGPFVGRLHVADIGAPRELVESLGEWG